MATVVIGATLADAEEFCVRNPDFSDAIRRSGRSAVPKDGLIVTGMVLTPRARSVHTAERDYIRHAASIAVRELTRSWFGVGSRGNF